MPMHFYGEAPAPYVQGTPMMGNPMAGGGMMPDSMMGGMPPLGAPEQDTGPAEPTEIIRTILDLADAYRRQEQDQQNLLLMEKVRTMMQQLLANEERELDGMMQGNFTPSAIRRFSGGPA